MVILHHLLDFPGIPRGSSAFPFHSPCFFASFSNHPRVAPLPCRIPGGLSTMDRWLVCSWLATNPAIPDTLFIYVYIYTHTYVCIYVCVCVFLG